MKCFLFCWCLLSGPFLGLAQSAQAQAAQEEAVRPIEVRVASITDTLVYIDHGQDAGIRQGDRVTVFPGGAPSVQAVVRQVTRNNARIELFEPVSDLALGTRCDVFLKARGKPRSTASGMPTPSAPAVVRPVVELEAERRIPEHPAWSRPQEDWNPKGSLLTEAPSISADERPLDWDAHWSLSGSFTESDLAGSRQSLLARSNFGWAARNAFGRGGEFEVDASAYTRSSDTGEGFEEQQSRLRLNRFNYVVGGRREQPMRYGFGRFVQHEMPEFGRLDGIEVGRRLQSGRQLGFSAGHMPGLSDDLGSGEDWQVALNFSEALNAERGLYWRTGYQKTWHQGHPDRDLFLLGSRWSPGLGDSLSATAWVDWYGNGDGPKSEGPELTRLHLFASHATSLGSGYRLSHSRSRLPFVLRQQFDAPAEDLDLNGVVERTSLSHWSRLGRDRRIRTRLEYWEDEQNTGLNGELAHEWLGLLSRNTDLEATLSGSEGSFSKSIGLRLGLRTFQGSSFWQVSWQGRRLSESTLATDDNDAIWQHDLRASLNRRIFGGWNLSLNLDLGLGEEQGSRRLGFHLGRRF